MNSGSVVIRIATTADIPSLAGVQLRSALAGFAHIYPESIPKPTQQSLEEEWSGLLAHPNLAIVVATVDGETVGAAAFGADTIDAYGTDAVLLKLYLSPEYAGKGIGGLLHDRAIADLVEAGHQRVRLWVLERNILARRMYERRGWRLQHWSRSDFPGSGILEVGYVLELPHSSAM